MKTTFFQRHSLLVLCIVFFLVPFALRGSRLALQDMKNDVRDWLPSDFPETRVLEWFGKHFVHEQFVVISWPGCSVDDQRYRLMTEKLLRQVRPRDEVETMPTAEQAAADPEMKARREYLKTRQMGDRLGLFYTGDYHENWGGRKERWLRGHGDQWYFVTPDGKLYRWNSGNSVLSAARAWWDRRRGRTVDGTLVAQLERDPDDGISPYYRDPRQMTARLFSSIVTGPSVLEQLTEPGGPLWPYGDIPEADKPRIARTEALQRLSGNLFGPPLHEDFDWTSETLANRLPKYRLDEMPRDWQVQFDAFVARLVDEQYAGDVERLAKAPYAERQQHWEAAFAELGVAPPAPQTCIVATISPAGKADLRRVVGRPLLGRPRGQLLAVAEECGITTGDDGELRLGGPPVDNVAIDEEGSITLVRLVGFCIAIGLGLSLLCLRSILVTIMVFLVGGISAVTSLSLVHWSGWTLDAVLMSMPSLVYVLGISGAVHIVNYYRDSCHEHGPRGAPTEALRMGWGPCSLAAFTTALGLASLYASNLMPIKKFGLFSALGVLATLALLFTYLPAALQLWPPGYHRRKRRQSDAPTRLTNFWLSFGRKIVRHHNLVATACVLLMVALGLGIPNINTSVQLLKLFDQNAKIIRDYRWMEQNLGELVPMEVVLRVHPRALRPTTEELLNQETPDPENRFQLTLLERMELARRVQRAIEQEFGPEGRGIVGRGMSAATFGPPVPSAAQGSWAGRTRNIINAKLESNYEQLIATDYLRIDTAREQKGSELWRISLRLGALNDVDYGMFVHELKDVVEPILAAYRARDEVLRAIAARRADTEDADLGFLRARIAVLGASDPLAHKSPAAEAQAIPLRTVAATSSSDTSDISRIDQSHLFVKTLGELLVDAGFHGPYRVDWVHPDEMPLTRDELREGLKAYDCVLLVANNAGYDVDFLRAEAATFVDVRDHQYPAPDAPTAADRNADIQAVYTGVVPVVYKAQRTLLTSLIDSIGWAFVMIATVMMLLLRTGPLRPLGLLNVRGGLLSMIPNVFPVVTIFGAMGHLGIAVDIGSMMTASVAMGIAVDDTIHFLTWFRSGLRQGLDRAGAIELAYERCASAMTATTLIGGLGLSVFFLSTFTPTQRFGALMLTLLTAALFGDLIFLPALLAGPLGRCFQPKRTATPASAASQEVFRVIDPRFPDTGHAPLTPPHYLDNGNVPRSDHEPNIPRSP